MAENNDLVMSKELMEIVNKIPKLTSEDVADSVLYALSTPPHVQVRIIKLAIFFTKLLQFCF